MLILLVFNKQSQKNTHKNPLWNWQALPIICDCHPFIVTKELIKMIFFPPWKNKILEIFLEKIYLRTRPLSINLQTSLLWQKCLYHKKQEQNVSQSLKLPLPRRGCLLCRSGSVCLPANLCWRLAIVPLVVGVCSSTSDSPALTTTLLSPFVRDRP